MARAWLLLFLLCMGPAFAGAAITPARLREGPDSIASLLRLQFQGMLVYLFA